MSLPRLPGWVPARESQSSRSTARRSAINRASDPSESRIRLAARDPVPVVYGRTRVEPLIFAAGQDGEKLVVGLLWGFGPMPSAPVLTTRDGGDLPTSVEVDHVLGSPTQTPHPWLEAAVEGYADALIAQGAGETRPLAYTVARMQPDTRIDISGEVIGPALYDPRTDSDVSPALNPALWLLDWLSDPVYGAGQSVDWAGSIAAIDAADEDLGGEPRRWGGLRIDRAADHSSHVESLRTYAGSLIVQTDDGLRLVPRRPQTPGREIPPDQWVGDLNIERLSRDQRPTVVGVEYTDTRSLPWRRKTAWVYADGVEAGTAPWRQSTVRLPGYQSHAVAKREAIERLNHSTLAHYVIRGISTDEALREQPGDVVQITHPDGLSLQPARVLSVTPVDAGRWEVLCEPYSDLLFSDVVEPDPDPLSTPLPDPTDPPAPVTGLAVVEEVFQRRNGLYATRLRVTWDATEWPYVRGYKVDVYEAGTSLAWRIETRDTEAVTGDLQEQTEYRVEVAVVGTLVTGDPAAKTVVAQGKLLTPGDVPQITATRVGADAVRLSWQAAIDVDIWRYEVRQGADWNSGAVVDRTDGLTLDVQGLSLGTHQWHVKAIDSVGQYSSGAASSALTLTPPDSPVSLTAFEVGGEVRLSWPASASPYVDRYEVRWSAPSGFTWAGAAPLDRVDALRLVSRDLPPGTARFEVRAIDAAGNMATSGPQAETEVTLDDNAFLADQYNYTAPSLTSMETFRWRHRPGRRVDYTDSGETWATRFPSAMSTYTNAVATVQTAPASEWLSEEHDLGVSVSGDWRGELGATALTGSVTVHQLIKESGGTYTAEALSVKRAGQIVRLRAQGAAGDVLRVETPPAQTRVDVVVREESGTITTVSSGASTVTLDRVFAFARSITLTPSGTASRQAVVDNIVTGDPSTFDVYLFDDAGAQIAGDVMWSFKGV